MSSSLSFAISLRFFSISRRPILMGSKTASFSVSKSVLSGLRSLVDRTTSRRSCLATAFRVSDPKISLRREMALRSSRKVLK